MAGTLTLTCGRRGSHGIVLPITLVLLLVLAVSSTSMLHVTRKAGYSSSGYFAHLETFYRAEKALRATETALLDLIVNCSEQLDECPDQDYWVRINVSPEPERGVTGKPFIWNPHPDSSAEYGSIEYAVELIDQGSFKDAPDQLYNIYQVSIRAGGPGFSAYSSLASTIALCVANEKSEEPACKAEGLRGNWRITKP